jgi:TPR repeat protein
MNRSNFQPEYVIFVDDFNQQIFLTNTDFGEMGKLLRMRGLLGSGRKNASTSFDKLVSVYPEAQYLFAINVLETSFDLSVVLQAISMLRTSASGGYPPALYRLGAELDTGDHTHQCKSTARELFAKAAELGHAHSMWIHGIDLIYGDDATLHQVSKGMRFVKKSARLGFHGALETLARWHDEGSFSFQKSEVLANKYRLITEKKWTISY